MCVCGGGGVIWGKGEGEGGGWDNVFMQPLPYKNITCMQSQKFCVCVCVFVYGSFSGKVYHKHYMKAKN